MAQNGNAFDFSRSLLTPTNLSERFIAFNKQHTAVKPISTGLFCLDIPGLETELMAAHTIRLFAKYNVALCTNQELPRLVPSYYVNYAQNMNTNDDSGFGWAWVDESNGTIVWDDAWTIATPASFFVLDHEITDRYLAEGDVTISQTYVDNADRLQQLELQRELKYYKQRVNKHKLNSDTAAAVGTKEAMESFAKRRKMLNEAAAAKMDAV
ncbi:hypothetical protein B0H17DRAFT_1139050 [Mycena rosella]|uniref:Uncharacterized protein n=1 Tax=Mycena rosella TaxID=1033263 RepID=A0AAD7D8Q6_MYCRO|nr:hypothetical protein B0H17DRAFT_1139050 [Mycena rosella]